MSEERASPVRVPAATRAEEREAERLAVYRREREGVERRRQVRGLVLLALAVMLFSLWRAGADRVWTPGWWRLW